MPITLTTGPHLENGSRARRSFCQCPSPSERCDHLRTAPDLEAVRWTGRRQAPPPRSQLDASRRCRPALQRGRASARLPEPGHRRQAGRRHERGIIAIPRPPYPELYAKLYGPPLEHSGRRVESAAPTAVPSTMATTGRPCWAAPTRARTPSGGDGRVPAAGVHHGSGRPGRPGRRASAVHRRPARPWRQPARGGGQRSGRAGGVAGVDQADDAAAGRHYRQAVSYARRSSGCAGRLHAQVHGPVDGRDGPGQRCGRLVGQARGVHPAAAAPRRRLAGRHRGHRPRQCRGRRRHLAACKRAETAVAAGHDPSWPWLFPVRRAKLASYVGTCDPATAAGRPCRRSPRPWTGSARPGPSSAAWYWRTWPPTIAPSGTTTRPAAAEAHAIGVERRSAKVLQRVRLAA